MEEHPAFGAWLRRGSFGEQTSRPAVPGGAWVIAKGPSDMSSCNAPSAEAGNQRADSERWGRIPSWWLDHPEIDADALAVLSALATFANRQGRCWPSQTTLATKLKRSRAWVNKTLGRLADAGLIAVRDRWSENGGRLSSLYELQTAPEGAPATNSPVAEADAPCQPRRHEQPDFKQKPDSLTVSAPEPAIAPGEDWTPSAEDRAWAESRHGAIDLDRHVETFRLRCQAHGYRYRDVSAAWRAWLNQDVAAGKAPSAAKSSNPSPKSAAPRNSAPNLDAWMAAASRVQAAVLY